MLGNVMTATISSYNGYMSKALKNVPSPLKQFPKPQSNSQYEKVLSLANQPVPTYQSGLSLFTAGKMEKALEKFSKALDNLDQLDIKHRIDIYSMISECYLRMENSDGYVQYKVKQIRMERKLKTLLQTVFPDKKNAFGQFGWSTTQEASKRLLKIKLMSARVNNPQMKAMLYRAELDLEVARKVSQ
jgi:tetratricopeptide (TPR) repeat protein